MRLATVALFTAIALSPAAAFAGEEVAASDRESAIEKPAEVAVAPKKAERRRLTTAERWRGKPYLRSAENQALRSEVLGRSLPIDRPGLGPMTVRASEAEPLRSQALDMALPMRSPLGGF